MSDVRGEIPSQVDGQDLGSINSGHGLIHSPRNTTKDLTDKLDSKTFAKEGDEDLLEVKLEVELAYKSNHHDGGSTHHFLVTISRDGVPGELKTDDLSDVSTVCH